MRRLDLLLVLLLLGCGDSEPPSAPAEVVGQDAADVPAGDVAAGEDVAADSGPAGELPGPDTADAGEADAADALDAVPTDTGPQLWRSLLYPQDWTPAFEDGEGRFLHDFSYAGYRNGEEEPGAAIPELVIDVVADHGADPTGASASDGAIAAAIDAAAAGGGAVVYFPPGLYRVDGQLTVGASSVVLRGAGPEESRIHFTQHAGMSYASHLTFQGDVAHDLELPLASDGEARAFVVEVEDATAIQVGDDVAIGWVITEEFRNEHGMLAFWPAFADTWQPFFLREVVAIDTGTTPHRIIVDVPLRYPARVAHQASIRRLTGLLSECGVEDLGLGNAVGWDDAWDNDQVHVLEMTGVKDAWIRRVASFAPPSAPADGAGAGMHLQSGGVLIRSSKRVTVADSELRLAQHRGGGGNGYLFEVRQSNEVLFRDCKGEDGRHNFIQNWGFGVTGCVWLRVESRGGVSMLSKALPGIGGVGYSEFHHSLATANLIDSCVMDDGWSAVNRRAESTGAGHTATENLLWNTTGAGLVRSRQFGWGYVIGTGPDITVLTELGPQSDGNGTEPEDWVEGQGEAASLEPPSLYEDQLSRRLGSD